MYTRRKSSLFLSATLLLLPALLLSQSDGFQMTTLSLNDLSAFRPQAGNWRIVGDVSFDRNSDSHTWHQAKPVPPPPPMEAKSAKKRKNLPPPPPPPPPAPMPYKITEGKGIVLNWNDSSRHDALMTTWEHGDIDLEMELMVPKGSNSGIYLQGRYEVQVFDSWGVKNPTFSDIGGIFRNWESTPGNIYMGKAPLTNAARAPGLWQHIFISFRAPRFDAQGRKIANARLEKVVLNGVTIHENVEIPLPTGGPIANDEKPLGPIFFQGDHGPVAFRNIKYRMFSDKAAQLTDLTYRSWNGLFQNEDEYRNRKPDKTGALTGLTWESAVPNNDTFGLHVKGKLFVPESDTYEFLARSFGGAALYIDGKKVLDHPRAYSWMDKTCRTELSAGAHDFEFYYHRHEYWSGPAFTLSIEGSKLRRQALQSLSAFPIDNPVTPVLVEPGNETRILRAFLDFNFDRKLRRTHTVGVGDPKGVHYVFDQNLGTLSCVWRGHFVDATPMWHDRGDGSFLPQGDVLFLFNTPQVAALASVDAAFPKEWNAADFRAKGYRVDPDGGRPTFRYQVKDLLLEDHTAPAADGPYLTRSIKVAEGQAAGKNLYLKLASGADISELPDGAFSIDRRYYIQVQGPDKPRVRAGADGAQELVVSLDKGAVTYSIIW